MNKERLNLALGTGGVMLVVCVLVYQIAGYGRRWERGRYGMQRSLVAQDGRHYRDGTEIDLISLSMIRADVEEEMMLGIWSFNAVLAYSLYAGQKGRNSGLGGSMVDLLKWLLLCGTLTGISFMVAISMPESRMRDVVLQISGWAVALFCGVYCISPIDILPEAFLGPFGLPDDIAAVVGGIAAAASAMSAGSRLKRDVA